MVCTLPLEVFDKYYYVVLVSIQDTHAHALSNTDATHWHANHVWELQSHVASSCVFDWAT